MHSNLPKAVLDSADVSAITQLILLERQSRDLGNWDQMRECFWPDSSIRVSWFRGNGADFVAASIDMARRGIPAKHRLGPILVTLAGNRAVASLTAIIDLPVKLGGVEGILSTHARFLYRVERREERWRIADFDAIYMRDELTPAIPGERIAVGADAVKGFRASYRMLSYYLGSQGYEIDSNLPGEDRPELVGALRDEVSSWMRGASLPRSNR